MNGQKSRRTAIVKRTRGLEANPEIVQRLSEVFVAHGGMSRLRWQLPASCDQYHGKRDGLSISRRSGFQAPHEKVVYHGQYWQIACQSHFSGQQGAFAYGPETGRCGRHFARRMYQRGALERYGKGHSG